jgi:putative transposase
MARPLRIEFPGACYHIINRGNYRRDLFADEGAKKAFEHTLDEAATRFAWRVHAFVIMRNHFHLALELTEPNLSEGMRWLQGTWVRRYNAYWKVVGKPFQGRYKSILVERGASLARVCHYIHLNPVRAGAVTFEKLPTWPGSSLTYYCGNSKPWSRGNKKSRLKKRTDAKQDKQRYEWLNPQVLLREAGGYPDTPKGWTGYMNYLSILLEDPSSKKELISAKLSRGWCLGGAEFKQSMRAEAKARGADLARERFEGLEPDELRSERELVWEETLQALARVSAVSLENLAPKLSDPNKVLLAACMRHCRSVPNAWLANRLKMGQPASVSQFVRRLRLRSGGMAEIQSIISKVKH